MFNNPLVPLFLYLLGALCFVVGTAYSIIGIYMSK